MRELTNGRIGISVRPGVVAFVSVVAAILAASPRVARAQQTPGSAKNQKTLMAADHAFVESANKANAKAAASMLDSRFTWTNRDGKTWTRSKALADWKALAPSMGNENSFQPRVYGRVGVVIGMARAGGHQMRFGRFWIAEPAGWKLIVYQEMPILPPPPPPAPPAKSGPRATCINPCQEAPYEPKTAAVHRVVASWQKLETGNIDRDPQAWAAHVTDDFLLIRPSGQVMNKADRLAQLDREKADSLVVHVPTARWLRVWLFGNSAVMVAGHRQPDGTPDRASRIWVLRHGVWQLAVSLQTIIK